MKSFKEYLADEAYYDELIEISMQDKRRKNDLGTYVCIEYIKNDALVKFYEWFSQFVKKPTPIEQLHTTIIHSEKSPFFADIMPELNGLTLALDQPRFSLFGENQDILVIEFDSSVLQFRQQSLLNRYKKLKTSFDVYRPHITIEEDTDHTHASVAQLNSFESPQAFFTLTISKEVIEPVKE